MTPKRNLSKSKKRFFNILLVCLGLVLGLGLVEGGMRLAGWGIIAAQEEIGNAIRPGDQQAIRIVTVGESTTADWFSQGYSSAWPRQLERLLRRHGGNFRVYNLGRAATTTGHILARLPAQLDLYKPQIVISMMGINDPHGLLITPAHLGFLGNLRILRLLRFVRSAFASRRVFTPLREAEFWNLPSSSRIVARLKKENLSSVEPEIQKAIAGMKAARKAQYYAFLAKEVEPELAPPSSEFLNAYLLYERSLREYFEVGGATAQYVFLMDKVNRYENCLAAARRYREAYHVFSDFMIMGLDRCVEHTKDKAPWLSLLGSNSEGLETSLSTSRQENSMYNHRAVHRLLRERGIAHIEMSYPTNKLDHLRALYDSEEEFKDIVFVENFSNFQKALRVHKYGDVFTDRFATTFGHTTKLGHALIARQACKGVVRVLRRMGNSEPIDCD